MRYSKEQRDLWKKIESKCNTNLEDWATCGKCRGSGEDGDEINCNYCNGSGGTGELFDLTNYQTWKKVISVINYSMEHNYGNKFDLNLLIKEIDEFREEWHEG